LIDPEAFARNVEIESRIETNIKTPQTVDQAISVDKLCPPPGH
jgi:hypothetical protein